MAEEKYYVPDISEFCVGFEYEQKDTFADGAVKTQEDFDRHKWRKEVFEINDFPYVWRQLAGKNHENGLIGVRVKYLSKECIEGFGFYQTDYKQKTPSNQIPPVLSETIEFKHERLNIALSFMPERSTVFIFEVRDDGEIAFCLFAGKCYNKSELRWVMDRLGINTEK